MRKEFYDVATCNQKLGMEILARISASKFFHPNGDFFYLAIISNVVTNLILYFSLKYI
jgi:hypothetical protein